MPSPQPVGLLAVLTLACFEKEAAYPGFLGNRLQGRLLSLVSVRYVLGCFFGGKLPEVKQCSLKNIYSIFLLPQLPEFILRVVCYTFLILLIFLRRFGGEIIILAGYLLVDRFL
jgi:hypothetical protein